MLYIVSTPIGNLEDITFRAVKTLKTVDYIAAEDTRHTKKLLNHYQIEAQMLSFHAHSSPHKIEKILTLLKSDKTIALVSDAGTPGISDPGYILIKQAVEQGIKVIPIPGASALLPALVASGLPMNQFLYLGFIPAKKGRQTLFQSLITESRTTIFYESPHRLLKTLTQISTILQPTRKMVIARELTKIHEEFIHGTAVELLAHFQANKPKGEFVLIISGQ